MTIPHDHHLHLPEAVKVADRRGLTAQGAIAVALGAGLLGGAIDVVTGPGLRTVFALCFIAGCAFAAYRVHREDLLAAVVIPPLVYVVIAGIAGIGSRGTVAPGSFLKQQILELFTALILGAPLFGVPALLIATALAGGIALWRGLSQRNSS